MEPTACPHHSCMRSGEDLAPPGEWRRAPQILQAQSQRGGAAASPRPQVWIAAVPHRVSRRRGQEYQS